MGSVPRMDQRRNAEEFTTRELLGIGFLVLLDRLDRIEARMRRNERENMTDLSAIQDAVTQNGNAVDSAIQLLNRLADEVRQAGTDPAAVAALAESMNRLADEVRQAGTDPAAVAALAESIQAEASNLAAAVVANTPAEASNPTDAGEPADQGTTTDPSAAGDSTPDQGGAGDPNTVTTEDVTANALDALDALEAQG